MTMSRRQFLGLVGAVAAATGLPNAAVAETLLAQGRPARAAAELTTLAQTLRAGAAVNDGGYRPVVRSSGEPHVVRDDLVAGQTGRHGRRRSVLSFVHHTDQHIIDAQSPSRVEFLDRYEEEPCTEATFFSSAFRAHEAANARIADAMQRRVRRIEVSPVTGAPITAAVCTGDNTDNQQLNELQVFLGVMNGGRVTPQSGHPDRYEGVQASGDPAYWHPDPAVQDRYKQLHGFPARAGFLEAALAPFDAAGAGTAWYSCFGNHDGLAQGNAPANPAFEAIGVGPLKVVGAPPGANPCTGFDDLMALPDYVGVAPTQPTTADPARRYVSRREWMQAHLAAGGMPSGHGFTTRNVEENRAYYTVDVGAVRWIVLDTVNPGGHSSGSVGAAQLAWLDAELARAQHERRLTMLFSHHGLRSLNNPVQSPDPLLAEDNDLPRYQADAILEVVSAYPCVIAWVNGHSHANIIKAQPGPFWEIGTAAHIDWPAQSRLLEVVDNRDGTLSIFTTMVDHEDDEIAAFARELSLNDPQYGVDRAAGLGRVEDRNAELLLAHPFTEAQATPPVSAGVAGQAGSDWAQGQEAGRGAAPVAAPVAAPAAAPVAGPGAAPPGVRTAAALPATGLPTGMGLGGALFAAGAIGVRNLHRRARDIATRDTASNPTEG